jgi:hypothetical protein
MENIDNKIICMLLILLYGDDMSFTVFISHSTKDMELVYLLAMCLRMNKINVHVAEWYEQPGRYLPEKIAELIRKSDCILALLTINGERAPWVNQEIGYAKGVGKLIIPVVEEGVQVTGFLQGLEYIPFKRDNPYDAITRATKYLQTLKIRKEEEERQKKAITGLFAILFGLLALEASGKESK